MTDRDRYQLRGPVRTVRSEFALVNPETSEWDAFRQGATIAFDRDQIDELRAATIAYLRDRVFSTVEYRYDDRGRVARLLSRMPPVSESTRTFAYDEHDNVVEEHYEHASRDAGFDVFGNEVTSNETSHESWNRYEYRHDEHGNWVEKVTFRREAPDRNFHRSSIERHTITYFEHPVQNSRSASGQT